MVPDLSLALIEMGVSLEGLSSYVDQKFSKPSTALTTSAETEPHVPKMLSVNKSQSQPHYVHNSLPPFPDKHTYIQTAARRHPSTDYELVREKAANQKKTAETALTKFIAKTGDSNYYCDDVDNVINSLYPLIACKPTPLPYLSALLHKDESELATFELKQQRKTPASSKKMKLDAVKSEETGSTLNFNQLNPEVMEYD